MIAAIRRASSFVNILAAERYALLLTGPGRREAAGHTCAGSAEKETSWAVPRFLGITQRVPIAVVVALTGEHFGFVMLTFFSVRFCSGNDRRDILCWRWPSNNKDGRMC
jgi:hypothetical protein